MADTHDLTFVQGQRFPRGFRWIKDGVTQSLAGYSWRAQVRKSESTKAPLLLDLTPLITLNADGVTLELNVSALVTAALDPKKFDEAAWDLFLWPTGDPASAFLLVQGAATCDPSSTDMTGG